MSEANTTQEIDGPDEQLQPLLGTDETEQFRGRWRSIQSNFVDEPEHSVREAVQAERQSLESQFSQKDEVSTEELRVALQRYRSFFERLLAT
jgi:hypothetical protein